LELRQAEVADLVTDLIYLRKERGFVAPRIYEANVFMLVIGGKSQIFESVKTRFIAAIHSLPDKQGAEALLAAYGLLPGYGNITSLKARRVKYGQAVKRKYDTLADRETAAIEELAVRLMTAYYSGAPLAAELPIPHGGFLMPQLAVTTLIRDRRFIEHRQAKKVISLVSGAKGFKYGSNEKTKIIPIDGIGVQTEYVKGGSIHTLLFPVPLKRGQTHTFSFTEISVAEEKDEDIKEDFAGQSFETPALVYRQKVVFEGEVPPVIWSYDKFSRIDRPGEPSDEKRLLVDDSGAVQKEFTQLYGGLHSGIAWRW
jgi:hypothetical protein